MTAPESTRCDPDCTIREWQHDGPCEVQQFFDARTEAASCRVCGAANQPR
jgi:hypothetical protein